jgi:hypothetical protein
LNGECASQQKACFAGEVMNSGGRRFSPVCLRENGAMTDDLPEALAQGAILRQGEYAWDLSAFPAALIHAPTLTYACLGGQVWALRSDNSVYELYWLNADSSDRGEGEAWAEYATRSCEEVLARFNTLITGTDFAQEAQKYDFLETPYRLLFNAEFVTEHQFEALKLPSDEP